CTRTRMVAIAWGSYFDYW
nr:immunoglobulin heavy chain junction region [Macaca mulatta]MOX04570.1 immunoglobulin heavy chain junction region [Macaca mulatta]MOX06573.1 immunoglobulin heavy chain junction region [Macaca mulatta]